MILIDYLFIFITILISLFGILRGFVSQLFSLLLWSLFIYVIFYHLEYFMSIIDNHISLEPNYMRILTIGILTLLTIFLIFIINLTISKLIASTIFQNSNRVIGLFMAFIKSQIYIIIFILLLIDTSLYESIFNGSYFEPYYLELVEYISNYEYSLFNSL